MGLELGFGSKILVKQLQDFHSLLKLCNAWAVVNKSAWDFNSLGLLNLLNWNRAEQHYWWIFCYKSGNTTGRTWCPDFPGLEVCGDYMGGNTVGIVNMYSKFMGHNKMSLKVVLYPNIVNHISAQFFRLNCSMLRWKHLLSTFGFIPEAKIVLLV